MNNRNVLTVWTGGGVGWDCISLFPFYNFNFLFRQAVEFINHLVDLSFVFLDPRRAVCGGGSNRWLGGGLFLDDKVCHRIRQSKQSALSLDKWIVYLKLFLNRQPGLHVFRIQNGNTSTQCSRHDCAIPEG